MVARLGVGAHVETLATVVGRAYPGKDSEGSSEDGEENWEGNWEEPYCSVFEVLL